MSRLHTAVDWARANGLRLALEVLFNFALPFLIYDALRHRLGDVGALLASSAPPIAWSLIEFARRRRIDALSILVLAGIGLSLLAVVGGGSARFLQLREALVTGAIGAIFLGSAAIGRPLIYQLARASMLRKSAEEARAFENLRENAGFRRAMNVMTLVWGSGLIAQTAVACGLVLTLSIRDYLLAGPVIGYGTMGVLGLWTAWYVRRQKARGRRAAAVAGPAQADRGGPGELLTNSPPFA